MSINVLSMHHQYLLYVFQYQKDILRSSCFIALFMCFCSFVNDVGLSSCEQSNIKIRNISAEYGPATSYS